MKKEMTLGRIFRQPLLLVYVLYCFHYETALEGEICYSNFLVNY